MSVTVEFCDGPVVVRRPRPEPVVGAVVMFEGIVRAEENGRRIVALDYRTYDPMAERELKRLADSAVSAFDLAMLLVLHSRGLVPEGNCSFLLVTAAKNRKPALLAMDWFIDALKRDVPIWKYPVWATEMNTAMGVGS